MDSSSTPPNFNKNLVTDTNSKEMSPSEIQRRAFAEFAKKRDQIQAEALNKKMQEQKLNEQTPSNNVSMPSWGQMAKNLGQSIIKNAQSVASGNALKISSEEAESRLTVCRGCEFFNKEQERCGKCGCKMAVKTYLKAEKCPVGKW
jgi:hypothetical protein